MPENVLLGAWENLITLQYRSQHLCQQLSREANRLGYTGFAWMFDVQGEDEVLHQRRIYDYLQNRNDLPEWQNYQITLPKEVEQVTCKDIYEVVQKWIDLRIVLKNYCANWALEAGNLKDENSKLFFDWYVRDGFEEIQEYCDWLSWLKMPNADHAHLDRQALKTAELNRENVIKANKDFVLD